MAVLLKVLSYSDVMDPVKIVCMDVKTDVSSTGA